MPPINQQGSRAGLITTLVVFAILFIVSSVFAFQFYGKWQLEHANYEQYKKNYAEIVPLQVLNSGTIEALKNARTEQPSKYGIVSTDPLLDVQTKQLRELALIIRGVADTSDNPTTPAVEEANKAIADATARLKAANVNLPLPTSGLDRAIDSLTTEVVADAGMIGSLNTQLADANAKVKAAQDDTAKAATANAEALANLTKADAEKLAQAQSQVAAATASVDDIQKTITANGTQVQAASANADAALADAKKQISDGEKTIAQLKARLSNHRPSVENAAVRQADGKLVRVASNGVCYINLGQGDQVTPGLTFEVYDKSEGIPGIPENATADEQLPIGKGSIEITHVGTTSSECRVVRTTPGAVLSEGDLIANLVYDPHTKYNFFVYGDFDLSNNGRPNAPDAEVIKRLITQWGGRVGDSVNPGTDFVILGSEPVVPSFSKDEITAENQKKVDDAEAALAKYKAFEDEAKDLHIPIMNQNRFLYYIGFYDQAKR
jgi:predicted  nucleic acid-binding Zn-ribbon protein